MFEEMDMYEYHQSAGSLEQLGWLRNCFFSLAQQVAFQDPTYYALTVAARNNGRYWVSAFPYYLKYVAPGMGMNFRHVDLNMPQWMATSHGENHIQISISLD